MSSLPTGPTWRLAAAIGVLLAGAGTAGAGPRAVIELFTSQGCSSCPPADRLVGQWARDRSLVTLSFPVAYWDYLGWKDTLASPLFAARQRAYAQARGDRDIYTPQVVINGATHCLGSDRSFVEATIRRDAAGGLTVPVGLAAERDGFALSLGPGGGPADVWVVPIERNARVAIGRGENEGATVTYANVVRAIRKVAAYDGRAQTLHLDRAAVTAPDADAFVVLLQKEANGLPGAIVGAQEHALAPP